MDNVLIVNETLVEVKRKKSKCFFLKLKYYEKTYDSVRWDFFYYMLGILGFGTKWIRWILNCARMHRVCACMHRYLIVC